MKKVSLSRTAHVRARAENLILNPFSSPEPLGLICNRPRNDGLWGRECSQPKSSVLYCAWLQTRNDFPSRHFRNGKETGATSGTVTGDRGDTFASTWIAPPMLRFQGWKTFCASLIAGSRRAFLRVDCVGLCLFVTERVLTKTEWNARGVTVCFSKSLFTFVWSLFITTACNFWWQIACPFEVKSGNALLLD